jgi:Common central domain of tyrosinase
MSIFQIQKKSLPNPLLFIRSMSIELLDKIENFPFLQQMTSIDVGKPTYTEFTMTLEGLHAGVHAWVGGTMSDIATSPADPLFWLHHANIDRIYTLWQKTHPDNANTIHTLSGSDLNIDPWAGTESDYRHWDWVAYV